MSTRGLALADKVGRELFASAATTDIAPGVESSQKRRRLKRIESRARL